MYLPESFRESRLEVLHALIREHSFGTLASHCEGELQATHLPFLLDAEAGPFGTLIGHMARANPHWKALATGAEALLLFQGPHAYISPSWYVTELSVPTWNYVAVHAYGTPSLVEEPERVRDILERTVRTYEAGRPTAWETNRLPAEFVEKLQAAIVGFEVRITRLEGKWKLNQNRSAADRRGVVRGLAESAIPEDAAVAALMREMLGD
jgi:transcriptional regulator